MNALKYQSGFGNEFATEAIAGALPEGQNAPQKVAHGLYAEQFSGTAFTAPRSTNRRSWLYRLRPSVLHKPFQPMGKNLMQTAPLTDAVVTPNQLRWDPIPFPLETADFLDSLVTMGVCGNAALQSGVGIHIYTANASMQGRYFYNADGELLVVPQLGRLRFHTELGQLDVAPGEICVLPRGLKFRVELLEEKARGYICENYGAMFRLPELGPIGANGLANPRDFLTPTASYEDSEGDFQLIAKFGGQLFAAEIKHSPLDVVAWHGNYAPYKYDLAKFNTMNTVSYDHADPSIFTVLTSPSEIPGTANADFVIFPPRWMVAEKTFRPPYFHRNVMSEFMGLVFGQYDAKADGFVPGGASLHNCMAGHGPDAATFDTASNAELTPHYLAATLAFMFETRLMIQPTRFALSTEALQNGYWQCWQELQKNFVL
ncbi:MAG: homogentisate 1,2-dioxygenase [Acidobacteria bacterium]|nr:homogentisate 1,2-dioxygenase [Acidobacteriota bacterium]